MAVRCRGRNGYFFYAAHYTWVDQQGEGQACLYSNSPHTRSSPLTIDGPTLEVVRLLRTIARELEARHRVEVAHNSEQKARKHGKPKDKSRPPRGRLSGNRGA